MVPKGPGPGSAPCYLWLEHPLPTRLLAALSRDPWSTARHSHGATTKAARGFGRAANILPASTQVLP